MYDDGLNRGFFLSESTDKHAQKFYYNLKERRKERRKEKDRKWGIKSACVNMHKPWETDLRNPLQHSNTGFVN